MAERDETGIFGLFMAYETRVKPTLAKRYQHP